MENALAQIKKDRDSTQKEIERLIREIGDFNTRIERRHEEVRNLAQLKMEYDQIIEKVKGESE